MLNLEIVEMIRDNLLSNNKEAFLVFSNGEVASWNERVAEHSNITNVHVVPGSFNPLHKSHEEIYEDAPSGRIKVFTNMSMPAVGTYRFFELSIERVGKEILSEKDLKFRLDQFHRNYPVVVTRAPRFIEKIGIFSSYAENLTFYVGVDTIQRMKDDYGSLGIQGLNATFYVYDRVVNGKYKTLYTEFEDEDDGFVPYNCYRAEKNENRDFHSLKRSSTEIRENQDVSYETVNYWYE